MTQSHVVVSAVVLAVLGFMSTGCLGSAPPAKDASNTPAEAAPGRPEGGSDTVNSTPGSGNTGNGSPGPEGGPGSLGAGIGSGSGTGTGAGVSGNGSGSAAAK